MKVAHDLLYVEWKDHHSNQAWQSESEVDGSPAICRSVGWLWKEDDDTLVLVGALAEDGMDTVGNTQTIIRSCITQRMVLRKAKRNGRARHHVQPKPNPEAVHREHSQG